MSERDYISKTLDLEPLEKNANLPAVIEEDKHDHTDDDYEYARNNIREIIDSGKKTLEDISDVAHQSEQARDYEVTTQLIKALVDANKDLLELAEKRAKMKPRQAEQQNVTNNNLFVGSPTELLDMIKNNTGKNDN